MKNAATFRKENLFFVPGGTSRREFFQKILNSMLLVASGVGIATTVLFALTI